MKRLISMFIALFLLLTAVTGCGNSQSSSDAGQAETTAAQEDKSAAAAKSESQDKKKLTVAVSIRSMSSEYHVQYVEGAKSFIETLPEGTAELQVLPCEANDDKQINDIKALVARTGKDTILFVDPNQAPNVTAIAEICEDAGVYWSNAWNLPEGITPLDYKYFVCHQSCDGVKQGYDIAIEMFKNFDTPYKGKILAMQGMLANNAAIDRFNGLKKALAEHPGVELLDEQAGDWDTKKALSITETWLAKYKDIDGIWCASDGMALGIIQALKAKGLNGKIKVTGVDGIKDAIDAVASGDLVCTIANNGWMQGGYGVAFAYAAYTGKFDTSKESPERRMFYTDGFLITKDTLDEYNEKFVKNKPVYDYNNLDFIISRPMEIPK